MKKEAAFERKGRTITDLATGGTKDYGSISAAKEWSRKYQMENGGLGMGSVRVAKEQK